MMSTQSNKDGNPKEVYLRPNKNTPVEYIGNDENKETPPPPPLSPQMFIYQKLEEVAMKLPSRFFLYGSAGLLALAVSLKFMNKKKGAIKVGQLAVPGLMWGVYREIVKPKPADSK